MDSTGHASATETRWPPSFQGGLWPLITFGAAFALWVMTSNSVATWLWGAELSLVEESLWNVPSGIIQISLAVMVLRYEGVRLRKLGLSRHLLAPAVVATAGVIVAVHLALVGFAVLGGRSISVGLFEYYRSPPHNLSLSTVAIASFSTYLFVGPVEELAFRGYLQNKLIALLGHDFERIRTAAGIVLTGALFAVIHLPTLVLLDGLAVTQAVGNLVMLALSGIILGTIYALTHNLFLAMFLHSIGNFWPLVIDPGAGMWPNYGVILVVYAVLVIVYRHWAARRSCLPHGNDVEQPT